ncbi:MAG: EAL domain-containing protein [Alphaproteobacteria bacterium]
MSDEKTLKEQRDRYVAFSFAVADLFIEVAENGKVVHVSGASKALTGIDEKALLNRNWLDLFSTYEQAKLINAREQTVPGRRIGPVLVTLNEQIGQKIASFSAIRMPKNDRFYISLGVSNEFLARIAPMVGLPGSTGFSDYDAYADAARDAVFDARLWGRDVELTFLDFINAEDMQKRFGKDGWGKVENAIGELMAQYSFGGHCAGVVAEGRYSFVHDKSVNLDELKQKIADITRAAGMELEAQSRTVSGDLKNLDKKDIARALDFSIDEFGQKGTAKGVKTLDDGYAEYLASNEAKLKEFKSIIERVSFTQFFQPIVDIKTREATHYEILSRFENGDTQEWIRFGEDAGLAPDFDLAVCERAVNHIKFKAGNTRTRFSIDISGQSIGDEKFFKKLKEQLAKHKNLFERLSLEITESANIENLSETSTFIKELQKDGFKIGLDDFHPSAAAQQYLESIKADFIKIDGRYIRRITASTREAALVRNLVKMCQDNGTEIIAEGVEEKSQADLLAEMGVKYAQGNFYAPAGPRTDYIVK